MEFSISFDDRAILDGVNRALKLLQRPAPIMDEIGAQLEAAAYQRFDSKTDPTGAAWAPLSAATLARYEAERRKSGVDLGKQGSLLLMTNQLRGSLTHNAGDDWVEVGTSRASTGSKNSPPGRWQIGWLHETGTEHMPRRGILVADPETGALGDADRATVIDVINAFIDEAFSGRSG